MPAYAVMWFRRDLRLGRQPRPARGLRGRTRCCRCSCSTPPCGDPPGSPRRAYLAASLRALDASLRQRRRAAVGGHAATRCAGCCGRPRGRRRAGCTSPPTTAPYGAPARRGGRGGAGRARASSWCAPARRTPWRRAGSRNGSGDPYKVFTPFSRAWADHGWRAPVDAPTGASWLALAEGEPTSPTRPLPAGLTLPEAGEDAAAAALGGVPRAPGSPTTHAERDRPDLDGTSRMSVHLQVGRGPPAHAARRPGGRCRRRAPRRTARSWPGGSSTPTCSSTGRTPRGTTCARSSRGWRTTTPGDQLDAWQRGPHRLPDRRRRDAAAAAPPAGCTTGCG